MNRIVYEEYLKNLWGILDKKIRVNNHKMIWETPNVLTLPTSIHYIFFQMFFCCCLLCRKAKNIRTLKSKNLSDTILTNYVPVSLFKYAPSQWCTVNWVKYTFRAASCKKSLRKNKSIRKNKSTRKHILYLKMCFLVDLFFLVNLSFSY